MYTVAVAVAIADGLGEDVVAHHARVRRVGHPGKNGVGKMVTVLFGTAPSGRDKQPGRRGTLPRLAPLRTVLETFVSHGSSKPLTTHSQLLSSSRFPPPLPLAGELLVAE